MGKFGKRSSSSGNGGILGSGVFAMFGSQVVCKSTDDSIYCNIIKMFNLLIIFGIICAILYFIYYIFKNVLFASKRKR